MSSPTEQTPSSDQSGIRFTQDWSSMHEARWFTTLEHLRGTIANGLEVGCFEGRASRFFLQQILIDELSTLIVIDTFEGSPENETHKLEGLEERFDNNIKEFKSKVIKQKGESWFWLRRGIPNSLDFIYVDGSHRACDVLEDAVLSWRLLKPGGIMIFDDYEWKIIPGELNQPKMGISAFLDCFTEQFKFVFCGYQVVIKKNASTN